MLPVQAGACQATVAGQAVVQAELEKQLQTGSAVGGGLAGAWHRRHWGLGHCLAIVRK
jgi:hypothetical protein